MDPQEYYGKIEEWAKQGLFTRDAILNTLSDRIKNFGILEDDEEQQLYETFVSLCTSEDGTRYISEAAFISFLQRSGFLPPSMGEAGAILYRSLLNISQAPFYQHTAEKLTVDGLFRSLIWTDYDRSRRVYDESEDCRTRTPADTRRIIFQSLATVRIDKKTMSKEEVDEARKQSEQRAFGFPPFHAHRREYAESNCDEDGDEMLHDFLDALFVVQPTPKIWIAPVPRDCFRPLARELHRGQPYLHDLSIPVDDFRAFVKLLLFAHFGRPNVAVEKMIGLDYSADCISRRFIRDPDVGITWETFDQALTAAAELFTGLRNILSCLYTTDTASLAQRLPQPRNIATLPVFAQLSTIISDTVCFDQLQLYKSYNVHDTPINTSTLADEITAAPDPLILLISGKLTRTGEKATFGYYLPWAGGDDSSGLFLFQLSPFHDVFRGNGSRPGWVFERGELVFGERGNGVALVMNESLKRATILHNSSRQKGEPAYWATSWRGDWEEEVEVEEIEIWVED